jgi:peptide-methionine (R)-S-oxide reductase
MKRIEIVCANCGGHLVRLVTHLLMQGHVFQNEGFRRETGEKIDERHCVNSISMKFNDKDTA